MKENVRSFPPFLWIPFCFGVCIPRQTGLCHWHRSRSRMTLRRSGLKPALSQMPKEHQSGSSPEPVRGWLQLLTHREQGSRQVAPAELWGNAVKTFSVLWYVNLKVSLQLFGFIPLNYFHGFLGNFCYKILSFSLFPQCSQLSTPKVKVSVNASVKWKVCFVILFTALKTSEFMPSKASAAVLLFRLFTPHQSSELS